MKQFLKRMIGKKSTNITVNANFIDSIVNSSMPIDPSARIEHSEIAGKIKIGHRCLLYKVHIFGNVEIGNYTSVSGPGTDLCSVLNPILIGNFCSVARNTAFQEFTHDYTRCTSYFIGHHFFGEKSGSDAVSKGPIIVENDVWIGTQCVIMSGIKIGNGAVVASNSVVSSDVPPYAIVGGTPAKIIKYRFEEPIIKKLLEIEWWNWPFERIERNKELFYGELTLEKLNNIVK